MRQPLALAALAAIALLPSTAQAYRPFDGTDADVSGLREFELELAPVGVDRLGSRNYLVAPAMVLNLGIFGETELVADVDESVLLGRLPPGASRTQLLGSDILLKHVFRKGVLQDEDGPSIAAEAGLLLPQVNGFEAYGGSLDVITSYRWSWGTFHWNEWFQWNRKQHADLFTGVILEGPHDWAVRPVAELFYEKDFAGDGIASGLLGAIWTVADDWTLDAGLRAARNGSANELEARVGFTWATVFRSPEATAR